MPQTTQARSEDQRPRPQNAATSCRRLRGKVGCFVGQRFLYPAAFD